MKSFIFCLLQEQTEREILEQIFLCYGFQFILVFKYLLDLI